MYKLLRKYLAVALAGICVAGAFTGCASGGLSKTYTVEEASKTEVVKVGNETVTLDEVFLYVIQCAYTYDLDEKTAKESESTYKSTILEQIQDAKAKYQVALTADIEITDEIKAEINEAVDRYYETFGQELFEGCGISRDAIYQLFLEQRYISKLQEKTLNDLYEDYSKEAEDTYGDKTFIEVDYVMFPKTKTDADGQSVALSAEELAAAKQNAERARERALAGERIEDIGKEYGADSGVLADTQRTFIGIYEEALNTMLSQMKNGEISEIYEDDAGYMVMQMENDNDTEYRDYFIQTYAQKKAEESYAAMEKVWVSAMNISDDNIIGDTWEKLTIVDIADYTEAGRGRAPFPRPPRCSPSRCR